MKKIIKLSAIFFSICIFWGLIIEYRKRSLLLMPTEYKLVHKLVNRLAINNDLGDRPITIKIIAGNTMRYVLDDIDLCESKNCSYFVYLDPFKKYTGFRKDEVNEAIKQSYLRGYINGSATANGNISIDISSFKALEIKESFMAALLAHELVHVIRFDPYESSLKVLKKKDSKSNKMTDKEVKELFKSLSKEDETFADLAASLMLFHVDYPKNTYIEAIDYFYKEYGEVHIEYTTHPNLLERKKMIKAFMDDKSFYKEKLDNPAAPLVWRYNRDQNWLRLYPSKK